VTVWTKITAVSLIALLAGCGDREEILQGPRLDLRADLSAEAADADAALTAAEVENDRTRAISLPAQANLTSWTHRYGNAAHKVSHPALSSAPQSLWTAKIGSGNSRGHKITADPVVEDGRIFTLDSRARVTAVSPTGETLWTRDLTPASDKSDDASGGGLAIQDGVLYVTTGFGEIQALSAQTGAEAWTQRLDAPATGAPTVSGDLVYVVSADSIAWAINTTDGRVKWQVPGTPSLSNMVGGAGPAITDKLAIFAFGSGEILATFRQGGVRRWTANVLGERRGRAYSSVTDISGDPVIDGNTVYAANQSGRLVRLEASTGDRIWTASEGAYSPVWPVGDSVFLVSEQAELVRLDAETGDKIWGTELPYFTKEKVKRRKAVFAHYGPVLAGGRLWVGGSDGLIRSFDPVSGAQTGTLEIKGGASTNPVVVNNVMYVVSANGQLHAFR
jgi:outer membrane protein assembly factor BamB